MRGYESRPTWMLFLLTLAAVLILAGPARAMPDPAIGPGPATGAGAGAAMIAAGGAPVGAVGPPVIHAAPGRPGDAAIRRRGDLVAPGSDPAHRDGPTLPRETPWLPEAGRWPIIEAEAGRLMPPPDRDIRGIRFGPRTAIAGSDRGPWRRLATIQ